MIIVGISDIHNDVSRIDAISEDLCKADVVVISGDITNFGDKAAVANVIKTLRIYNETIVAVPGNCDPPEVSDYLTAHNINLDQTCRIVGGVVFAGIGGSLPCPSHTPNEISENEFRSHLAAAIGNMPKAMPLVLVTHQPPYGTLADVSGGFRHVGSESIRAFIEKNKPAVCFCGHIHEAQSVDRIDGTTIINPGPLRKGGYAYVEINGTTVTAEVRGM
jgi:hypothetical protein